MIAFTVPLFILILLTNDLIHGQPVINDIDHGDQRAVVLPRLKRAVYAAVPQHQIFDNHQNEDFWKLFDETPYSLNQRTNHKRLIDF